MTVRLETQCAQIETVVHDVPRACRWFEEVLGATPIEQDVVKRITGVVLDIDHRDCGDGMFQFCSVITDDMPHRWFIDTLGPCVTNLNFFVDDAEQAHDLLAAAGATTKIDVPIGRGLRALLGPEISRTEEEIGQLYFMGTWPLFGFDLEFTTRPWRDGTEQHVFHPAFTYPRPASEQRVERLAGLRVVLEDIDSAVGRLGALIDPGSRSSPVPGPATATERTTTVRLHDLELRYTQPLSARSPYHAALEAGGGIVAAIFRTSDPHAIVDGISDVGVEWLDNGPRIASRQVLGFDVELESTGVA
jgi:hypothetical protein